MISALAYLQYHTIKNKTLTRLKRLRQPKYLIGGIVGALYFYWYFFRFLFQGGRGGRAVFTSSAEDLVLLELMGAVILGVIMLAAWVFPNSRAALQFTEAEIAFLFPAPISRRGLIHYKLLRSQVGILFTVLLLTLVTNRLGGRAGIHAAGWWLALSTINLHMLGASFARTMLLDKGVSNWQRRLGVLGVVVVLVGAIFLWAREQAGDLPAISPQSLAPLKGWLVTALSSGPAAVVLWPFRLMVAPYLAPDAAALFAALPGALLILGLHYMWVVRSNVAFEEASVEASRKLAHQIAAVRAGNWNIRAPKPARAPFRLQPVGSPAVGLLWKNLIGATRGFSVRTLITIVIVGTAMTVGIGSAGSGGTLPTLAAMLSGMLLIWSLFVGPHLMRQDFRQDLPQADLLKLYPMRGWQIALGELLAPAIILTCIQWFLLAIGGVLSLNIPKTGLGSAEIFALVFSAAMLFPFINLLSLCIPNAAVLLFPAWFQTGKDGPHGIEATGQRLVAIVAQIFAFVLALIPVAAAAGLVFLVVFKSVGWPFATLAAALPAAVVLAAEFALAVYILGILFERYNLSEETTA
jgi:ABC-2 type transport system permease protein